MSVIRPFSLQSSLFFRWFIGWTFRTRKKRILLGRETRVVVEKREEEEEDRQGMQYELKSRKRDYERSYERGEEISLSKCSEYLLLLCFVFWCLPFSFSFSSFTHRLSCLLQIRWEMSTKIHLKPSGNNIVHITNLWGRVKAEESKASIDCERYLMQNWNKSTVDFVKEEVNGRIWPLQNNHLSIYFLPFERNTQDKQRDKQSDSLEKM